MKKHVNQGLAGIAAPSAIIAHLRGLLPDVEAARRYARTLAVPLDPAVEDYLWTHVGFWGSTAGVQCVRKRPGMYIGGTDGRGLAHAVYEALDGPCEEARQGELEQIVVEIRGDTAFTLAFTSALLPRFFVERQGERGLDRVLGRYDYVVEVPPVEHPDGYTFPRPTFAPAETPHTQEAERLDRMFWGLEAPCALSSRCAVTMWSGAEALHEVYLAGVPTRPERLDGGARPPGLLEAPRGVEIAYDLDPAFFDAGVAFDAATLAKRLDECAALAAPTHFTLLDRRSGESRCFHYPRGLARWLEVQAGDAPRLGDARQHEVREGEMRVRVAVLWTALPSPAQVITFANEVRTQGGTHLDGFLRGAADALRPVRRSRRQLPPALPPGLFAVVAVELPSPVFRNPVKEVLANPEVADVVAAVSSALLRGAPAVPPPPGWAG